MSGTTAERTYGGLTRREREARRREQLLDAGLEVFAAKGWSGATVLDVCRGAGLSQRYFYDEFPDREALFVAITERIAAEVQAVVRTAAGQPDRTPEDRVRRVLGALAAYFADDPRTVQVALVESFGTPELRAHRARLLAAFSAIAARLMRSLRPDPDGAGARGLLLSATVLSGGIAEALVAAATGDLPAERDELVDHLTRLYTAAAAMED